MKIDIANVQRMLEWVKTKLYLDSLAVNAARRTVKRGQVYRCNFGRGIGSEMQKDRPAVIVQNDIGNINSGNTIVIPITHDASTLLCVACITPQMDSNGNVILDGQANASNIMCVSKARLGDLICTLSPSDMKAIDAVLGKTLGIIKYYADIEKQLKDKLEFIEKIKTDRNHAQDQISEVKKILGLPEDTDLVEHFKKSLDKQQQVE